MTRTFEIARALAVSACVALVMVAARSTPARAQSADRVERRSEQMPLPDAYLDPSWPEDDSEKQIKPEESDNVQDVPLDEEKPDPGEAEEAERYNEELGQPAQPDEMQQDEMGAAAGQPQPDDEEARDPAQW